MLTQTKIPESVLVVIYTPELDVLLLERADRPGYWQSVTGSKDRVDEALRETAIREVAEETGIQLDTIGPRLWIRESRFRYRNHDHHRIDHVFLARPTRTAPSTVTRPTDNEKLGLIERRWHTADDLDTCRDKLLPASLPVLLRPILDGHLPAEPIRLDD